MPPDATVPQTPFLRTIRYLVLVAALILVWPIVSEFVTDWFLHSSVYPYGAVFMLTAFVFVWLRRPGRPVPEMDAKGLLMIAIACLGVIAGRLAAELLTSRISVWMLAVGFLWAYCGLGYVRHFAGPLVLDLCSIPVPQIVFNALSAPVLKALALCLIACCRLLDVPVLQDGNVLTTSNYTFSIPDSSSTLRQFPGLVVISYLLAQHFRRLEPHPLGRPRWNRLWLSFIAVPAVATLALVLMRLLVALVLSEKTSPETAQKFYLAFSGVWACIAGCILVFAAQLLLRGDGAAARAELNP